MTCIVGLVDIDGTVYIGGDSLGTDENGGTLLNAERKVFRSGDFLIGKSGCMRMGQIMRHTFKPPEYISELDREDAIYCYMTTLFVQEMKACFDKLEYKEEEKGAILVGFQGRLFKISADNFQVEEDTRGYNTIGIGADIANGSLYATRDVGYTPDFKVRLALEAAAEHNAYVKGPFLIESI